MRLSDIRWVQVCSLAIAAEVALIGATVIYMVIYGMLNPGYPEEFYQQHVRAAGPIISIVVGIPLFFLLARWLEACGKKRGQTKLSLTASLQISKIQSRTVDSSV